MFFFFFSQIERIRDLKRNSFRISHTVQYVSLMNDKIFSFKLKLLEYQSLFKNPFFFKIRNTLKKYEF